MRRLKSIDIFRGLSMIYFITLHTLTWWLVLEDKWFILFTISLFDFLGASGFLFVTGIATSLSYNNRKIKAQTTEDYDDKMLRNEYLLRVFILLIIAFLFNVVYRFLVGFKVINLWRWYILMTISFSLLFAWPLLKTSKFFRMFFCIVLWIFNIYFLEFLLQYEGDYNLYGILFYIFYYKLIDAPILIFFPFLLIGTVFGDVIFEIIQINDKIEKLLAIRRKMILPSLIIAPILIIIGVIFEFPNFFVNRGSFSWAIYCLGLILIVITILVSFEEFEIIKTEKSYKFLYYFSYYSLSVFIFHILLALLFYQKIRLQYIVFFIATTIILMAMFLKFLYKKIEGKYTIFNWQITFSLKLQISRMSKNIVRKRASNLKSNS